MHLQTYYSTATVKELKGNWCHNCYQDEKRDYMDVDGQRIKKMDIIKRKNDGEQEEAWVECDSCNRWVHQICGLFNKGRNNKDVCYLCPDCLCQGMDLSFSQACGKFAHPHSWLHAFDCLVWKAGIIRSLGTHQLAELEVLSHRHYDTAQQDGARM